jgi:isoleucyl-tRNA synthetase
MLQNLDDFDVSSFELNMDQLDDLDKYVVEKTNDVKNKVLKLADEYRFNESLNTLYNYCDFVSTVYLDSQKDRLYCLAKKDSRRVLTQQVLFYVQHNLMLLLLPFMPYSTEEFYSKSKNYGKESVLMEDFLSEAKTELNVSRFDELLEMRVTLNKMFEQERVNKTVSKNNEMFVYYPNELTNKEVSVMELMLGKPHFVKGESLLLKKHDYHRCDRCWNYFQFLEENGLCSSCHDVEKSL